MKTIALQKKEYLPVKTGANIMFHLIKWNNLMESFSMKVGGNINYHSLTTEGTSAHTHEFCEILLILSGKIGHWVNGEIHELISGTLVFIRPSDVHRFEPIGNQPCELVNFSFQLELLLEFSEYLGNDFFLKRFTAPVTPPVFKLSISESEQIASELLKINAGQASSPEIARIRVKAIIANLFIKYFLEPATSLMASSTPEWLEKLCEKMRKPENFTVGLKRLQQLAGCTPEHLCKSFRKYLEQTPTEYINELRVNHAARLLADTDDKIFSIATDLGFQSLSRFYHIFRKHYGMSPAKYRQLRRKTDIPV